MRLSNLTRDTSASVIREMFNRALAMEDTISFTVGEPDFVTPKPIIDAACKYWQKGMTHYTPNRGIPDLLNAIAEYHKTDLRPDPAEEILVSCGATEALQLALFTLVDPGDEVIVVTPSWPNYLGQIRMVGAKAVCVAAREENDFVPDLDDIKAAITPKTKAIILNSPSNPTGSVMGKDVCKDLAALLLQHDIYVISDEVYSRLVYDEAYTSISSFEGMQERTVYVNSFSKIFAMTGWRLGYAVAPGEIVRNMTKLHENGASCLPAPSQFAAAYGLRHCEGEIEAMRQSYQRRRDLMCSLINDIPGMSVRLPKGAFYAFANIKPLTAALGINSRAFCMDLLDKTGVVIVPGDGFGSSGEGYVRITYAAADETIREGMARIKTYVESIQRVPPV